MRHHLSGQWSVVSGQWSVVSGQWSVVSDQEVKWEVTAMRADGGRSNGRDDADTRGTSGGLQLRLRTYQRQLEPGVPCVEANFHYEEWPVAIPVAQAGLVLVDVWDIHYIQSHAART